LRPGFKLKTWIQKEIETGSRGIKQSSGGNGAEFEKGNRAKIEGNQAKVVGGMELKSVEPAFMRVEREAVGRESAADTCDKNMLSKLTESPTAPASPPAALAKRWQAAVFSDDPSRRRPDL
jgi:hypothetical protein